MVNKLTIWKVYPYGDDPYKYLLVDSYEVATQIANFYAKYEPSSFPRIEIVDVLSEMPPLYPRFDLYMLYYSAFDIKESEYRWVSDSELCNDVEWEIYGHDDCCLTVVGPAEKEEEIRQVYQQKLMEFKNLRQI